MSDSIYRVVERIKTKQDFLEFLALLRANREAVPAEWENETLDSFLEGLCGYVADTPDETMITGDAGEGLSWRRLADALLAARVYE